jgi:hypothetical protein
MNRKLLAAIHSLSKLAISADEYFKAHPKSKKDRNDPMFSGGGSKAPKAPKETPADKKYKDLQKKKQDGHPDTHGKSDLELAEMAGLKTTGGGGSGGWKSNELKHLKPDHKKAVEFSLNKLKEYGYPEIAKKIESGKMTLEQAGNWTENENMHGLAAMFRNEKGSDHALAMHAQERQDKLDGVNEGEHEKEAYANERNHALDARYESTNPSARINDHIKDLARKSKTTTMTASASSGR